MKSFTDYIRDTLSESTNKAKADKLRARARKILDAANRAERKQDAAREFDEAAKLMGQANLLDPPKTYTEKDSIDGIGYDSSQDAHTAIIGLRKNYYDTGLTLDKIKDGDKWYVVAKPIAGGRNK